MFEALGESGTNTPPSYSKLPYRDRACTPRTSIGIDGVKQGTYLCRTSAKGTNQPEQVPS